MKTHLTNVSLALLSAAFLLGCQEQGSEPAGPDVVVLEFEPQFDKPSNPPAVPCPGTGLDGPLPDEKGHCHDDGGGDTEVTWSFADARVHAGPGTNTLQSTCPGFPGAQPSKPSVEWNDRPDGEVDGSTDGCAQVTTTGTGTAAPVTLTNDAQLIVATKKGSTNFTIQFLIQDFGGPDGTQYRTDRFVIDAGKEFTPAGFTLHVHKAVDIYMLKGHTGGPKVENVGTIYIDDIVYR